MLKSIQRCGLALAGISLTSLLAFPLVSQAIDATVVGTEVRVDYTEPTTNANGTPLIDLDHISVYYQVNPDLTPPGEEVKDRDEPASSPTGGAANSVNVTVPVGADQEAFADLWVTAVDDVGNESGPSPKARVQIDHLPPAAPQ